MKTRIGHAHLKVRDLDRAVDFYERFLGLKLRERAGDRWAFMSATDVHHEIALQNVGADAPTPGRYSTGLFHVAFEVPDKRSLAMCYKNLLDHGIAVAVVDHRISWAIYFSDADENGLELYCDTRQDADGTELWAGQDRPLTHEQLLLLLDETD